MKVLPFMVAFCMLMLVIVYRTMIHQYQRIEMEATLQPFATPKERVSASRLIDGLPQGILHATSDLEMKPLWSSTKLDAEINKDEPTNQNLLAIPVGIKQKRNVDTIVQKFISENFTVILFHYDDNVSGWWDLRWSNQAIHIVARNQTKWWFAKRFLHPAVVSMYDYIFLWDEDLDVKNFNPRRYLNIVRSQGLEISQPALDPNSTDIHHRITVRARTKVFHRRVYEKRGSTKCTESSEGPPCSGFVEGMAPVFSRNAWYCTWHLVQNDLVHGWGLDMKLGYCAQGDRSLNVGVVDSEYVVHQGIQSLGGGGLPQRKRRSTSGLDSRMEIRRQSTMELQIFQDRWNKAVKEDRKWVDPFLRYRRKGTKL